MYIPMYSAKSLFLQFYTHTLFDCQEMFTELKYYSKIKLIEARIVGDNVDLEVHARIQTKEHGNKSLHWTHQYAELARVITPTAETKLAQKPVKDVQPVESLPSVDDLPSPKRMWAILISRVLGEYIPTLREFKDVVIHHIPHEYCEVRKWHRSHTQ